MPSRRKPRRRRLLALLLLLLLLLGGYGLFFTSGVNARSGFSSAGQSLVEESVSRRFRSTRHTTGGEALFDRGSSAGYTAFASPNPATGFSFSSADTASFSPWTSGAFGQEPTLAGHGPALFTDRLVYHTWARKRIGSRQLPGGTWPVFPGDDGHPDGSAPPVFDPGSANLPPYHPPTNTPPEPIIPQDDASPFFPGPMDPPSPPHQPQPPVDGEDPIAPPVPTPTPSAGLAALAMLGVLGLRRRRDR